MLRVVLKNGDSYSSEDVLLTDIEVASKLKEDFFFVETNSGSFFFAKDEIMKVDNLSKNKLNKNN